MCLLMVWNFLPIHVFFQAFMCALPILKVSAWSGAKSSLYGFLSVMFSHGFIELLNSCLSWYNLLNSYRLFLFVYFMVIYVPRTKHLTCKLFTLTEVPFYVWYWDMTCMYRIGADLPWAQFLWCRDPSQSSLPSPKGHWSITLVQG